MDVSSLGRERRDRGCRSFSDEERRKRGAKEDQNAKLTGGEESCREHDHDVPQSNVENSIRTQHTLLSLLSIDRVRDQQRNRDIHTDTNNRSQVKSSS